MSLISFAALTMFERMGAHDNRIMIYEYKKLSVYACNVPFDSRELYTLPGCSEQFHIPDDLQAITSNIDPCALN